jgi:hypothetical protein
LEQSILSLLRSLKQFKAKSDHPRFKIRESELSPFTIPPNIMQQLFVFVVSNTILWQSLLMVGETGVPAENNKILRRFAMQNITPAHI